MRYTLTAKLGYRTRSAKITARDSFDATMQAFDATMQAIDIVLDRAARIPTGAWALGRIELKDAYGTIIHSMDAKAPA